MANTLMKNDCYSDNPALDFYLDWFSPFTLLTEVEQAEHILCNSEIYQRHQLAKKYGKQLYNYYGKGSQITTDL